MITKIVKFNDIESCENSRPYSSETVRRWLASRDRVVSLKLDNCVRDVIHSTLRDACNLRRTATFNYVTFHDRIIALLSVGQYLRMRLSEARTCHQRY